MPPIAVTTNIRILRTVGEIMTYLDDTFRTNINVHDKAASVERGVRERTVLVIEDGVHLSDAFRSVCDCLSLGVEQMPSREELGAALRDIHPMAIVAEMDGAGQDGCHVLMTLAAYDPDLPVLLITGDDPALLGAIDAVEEIWKLSSVTKWPRLLGVGPVVDFLFQAGRKGNCMGLMSI
jgi:hypothetical protein